jgi:8-oxo-dGTP pyrophosphatase MutT (NUDIX family)
VKDAADHAAERLAGRMLLLDEADRVLLVHERVDVGSGATHWLVPGGGVEPGESTAAAAVRELAEETGYEVGLPVGGPVLLLRDRYLLDGRWWQQTNHFYLSRLTPGSRASTAVQPTALERQLVLGVRWWSVAELAATTEVINPRQVVATVTAAVGDSR